MADIRVGRIDFAVIFKQPETFWMRHYFIEHDDTKAFKTLERSINIYRENDISL